MTNDRDLNTETASLCKTLFERCKADDVEGAMAAVRDKIGPEKSLWEAALCLLGLQDALVRFQRLRPF